MRPLATIAAATLCLSLVACSNKHRGQEGDDTGEPPPDPETIDDDDDGYSEEEGDCDDEDDEIGPDAEEIPYDGVDNDCDPTTPDDDLDEDGYDKEHDCDDDDADINPGEVEIPYNGRDDDCNELTPDDDLDQDGFLHVADCDDEDYFVNPGVEEVPYNGKNDDCNDDTPDDDLDDDGFPIATDCDDEDPDTYPGAPEDLTDDKDNDCDDLVDERFELEVLDESGDRGSPSAVAVDSAGQVHVAYYDLDTGGIRYLIRDTSGSWSAGAEVVSPTDSDHFVGEYLDAAVDSADWLLVGYSHRKFDASADDAMEVDYILRDNTGSWSEQFVLDGDVSATSETTQVGEYLSVAFDPDDLPSFAYYDAVTQVPMLADFTTIGVLVVFYVDYNILGPSGWYTSIAVDSGGMDHVAYYDPSAFLGPEIQYTNYDPDFDSLSISESIDAAGTWTSIATRSDDVPCVAYHLVDSADLAYACEGSSGWDAETVDSTGAVGTHASLAFNADDEPYIAYYDETSHDLKLAHHDGEAWTVLVVDSDGDVGQAADLAIDYAGTVSITYYDATSGALRYARGR